jgi:DegV family protein with EDD domain
MKPLGILTDTSVSFQVPSFPGRHLVSLLPLHHINDADKMRQDIRNMLHQLLQEYQHVLVLSHAQALSPVVGWYREIINQDHLEARVTLIDSGSFSIGLGLLVEHAARHAAEPSPDPQHLTRHLRASSRRTFTLLAIENFDLLVLRGRLRPSQALLAEMLQFVPLYVLEQGELALFEKARNQRTFLQACEAFLEEFNHIEQIGLVYTGGRPPTSLLAIRKLVQEMLPESPVHTHHLTAAPPGIPENLQALIVVEPVNL